MHFECSWLAEEDWFVCRILDVARERRELRGPTPSTCGNGVSHGTMGMHSIEYKTNLSDDVIQENRAGRIDPRRNS